MRIKKRDKSRIHGDYIELRSLGFLDTQTVGDNGTLIEERANEIFTSSHSKPVSDLTCLAALVNFPILVTIIRKLYFRAFRFGLVTPHKGSSSFPRPR